MGHPQAYGVIHYLDESLLDDYSFPVKKLHRGSGAGDIMVREVVRESSGAGGGIVSWPTLMKTNYTEWAILMRVQL
jgi:hypothetical protein